MLKMVTTKKQYEFIAIVLKASRLAVKKPGLIIIGADVYLNRYDHL